MKILTKAVGTSYTISTSNGLAEAPTALEALLKDGRTYKGSVMTAATAIITLSASAADVALVATAVVGSSNNQDGTPAAAMSHSVTDVSISGGSTSDRAIALYAGTAYDFPELPNASYKPAQFNQDTTYHNNISGMGEFIGRSVIRRHGNGSIKTIAFVAPKTKLESIQRVFEEMRAAPFFVEHNLPDGLRACYYGWTEGEPTADYIGTLDYMQLSFSMRVWGQSIT